MQFREFMWMSMRHTEDDKELRRKGRRKKEGCDAVSFSLQPPSFSNISKLLRKIDLALWSTVSLFI